MSIWKKQTKPSRHYQNPPCKPGQVFLLIDRRIVVIKSVFRQGNGWTVSFEEKGKAGRNDTWETLPWHEFRAAIHI